jgi:hypothetical protein
VSLWDFTSIVSAFAVPGGVTITRRSAGSRVDGVYVPAAGTAVLLDPCAIINLAGRLQRRLNWNGTTDAIVVLANQPLYTIDEPNGRQADRLDWHGHTYECTRVDDLSDNANYWRGIFQKVSPQ